MTNKQVLLQERPTGNVTATTTKVVETAIATIGPDEALIKVGMLSIASATTTRFPASSYGTAGA